MDSYHAAIILVITFIMLCIATVVIACIMLFIARHDFRVSGSDGARSSEKLFWSPCKEDQNLMVEKEESLNEPLCLAGRDVSLRPCRDGILFLKACEKI